MKLKVTVNKRYPVKWTREITVSNGAGDKDATFTVDYYDTGLTLPDREAPELKDNNGFSEKELDKIADTIDELEDSGEVEIQI